MPKDKKPTMPPKPTKAELAALDRGLSSGNTDAKEVQAMKKQKAATTKKAPAKFNKGGKVTASGKACPPKGKK